MSTPYDKLVYEKLKAALQPDTNELSPANPDHYLRVLEWIYYFPQALPAYRRANRNNKRHAQEVEIILYGLTAMAALAGLLLLALLLTFRRPRPFWTDPLTWLAALALCTLVSAGSVALAWALVRRDRKYDLKPGAKGSIDTWMRRRPTNTLYTWPTAMFFGIVMYEPFLRIVQSTAMPWANEFVTFLLVGFFAGVIYSQVAAFVNSSVAYRRQLLMLSLAYFLAGFVVAPLVELAAARVDSLPRMLAYCLMTGVALALGFLLGAPRWDDRYLHQKRVPTVVDLGDAEYSDLPKVTPWPVPHLNELLGKALQKKWDDGMALSESVWENTRQHQAVIQALYAALVDAKPDKLGDRQQSIASAQKPWSDPEWFVNGGERSNAELFDRHATPLVLPLKPPANDPQAATRLYIDAAFFRTKYLWTGQIRKARKLADDKFLADSPRDLPQKLLMALNQLEGINDNTPFGAGSRRPLESKLPTLDGEPDKLLRYLREAYQHAWLAHRCQDPAHRTEALTIAQHYLADLVRGVDTSKNVDVYLRAEFDKLVTHWLADIDDMLAYDITPVEYQVRDKTDRSGDVTSAGENGENPFDYDEPLNDDKPLVGRKRSLAVLESAWPDSHLHVVEIKGPPLVGKTSLFLRGAQVYSKRTAKSGHSTVIAHIRLRDLNTAIPAPVRIANALFDELDYQLELPPSLNDLRLEPYRTLERMVRYLCARRTKVLVGVDDVDQLEHMLGVRDDFDRLIRFLFHLNETIPNFGAVLIGVGDFGHSQQYQQARARSTSFAAPIEIGALDPKEDRDEIDSFLNNPRKDYPHRFSPAGIQTILDESGGQPYLIQLIAWHVVHRFEQEYRFFNPAAGAAPLDKVRDPFFTPQDVQAVTAMPTFRVGHEYFKSRLCASFGDDWDDAEFILTWIAHRSGSFSLNDILAHCARRRSPLGTYQVDKTLKALVRQDLLYNLNNNIYSVRVGLIRQMFP